MSSDLNDAKRRLEQSDDDLAARHALPGDSEAGPEALPEPHLTPEEVAVELLFRAAPLIEASQELTERILTVIAAEATKQGKRRWPRIFGR